MENQLPIEQQVKLIQEAVDAYLADTGVLPIVTRDANTPIYEKYAIDFRTLDQRYLPYIPGAAFEQGGSYLFVLTDVETEPKARLLDLKIADQIATIQMRIKSYVETKKEWPVKGSYQGSVYHQIDFEKIGVKEEQTTVASPVTGDRLPIILSPDGVVGVDYASDLEKIIASVGIVEADELEDIRDLIPRNSLHVPVKSFPYAYEDGKLSLIR